MLNEEQAQTGNCSEHEDIVQMDEVQMSQPAWFWAM
jgi:hypothetical protein